MASSKRQKARTRVQGAADLVAVQMVSRVIVAEVLRCIGVRASLTDREVAEHNISVVLFRSLKGKGNT